MPGESRGNIIIAGRKLMARLTIEGGHHCHGASRLTRIIGRVITELYPVGGKVQARDRIVRELEQELDEWLKDTPEFFHPPPNNEAERRRWSGNNAFFDVPWTFRRQQRTIRASFYFTHILIYRSYLLEDYLQHGPRPRQTPPSSRITKLANNALGMAHLAAEVAVDINCNSVYWVLTLTLSCDLANMC